MQQLFLLLIFLIQPYMFRTTNSPILRNNFWLYTAFSTMHRHCCRPIPWHQSAAVSVHCTKSCI